MSEEGSKLFEELKVKIEDLKHEGTEIQNFTDYWRFICNSKYKAIDTKYQYDQTSREFVEEHKEQLNKMRDEFLDNLDFYVEKCIKVMTEKNHFKVYYAKTNQEAQDLFIKELGDNKVLYKSKSLEALDIGIIERLKKENILIKETDLGDILFELFDVKEPVFALAKGIQYTEKQIAEQIKLKYGVELEPTSEAIVDFFRTTYRKELFNDVKVCLTSANAISADDGTIFLTENEGNISIITRSTDKHIVVVGITKIVPTVFDALLVAKTQQRMLNLEGAYISLISAPSNTSDVQLKRVFGMYGAKEVVVIFVDDWRKRALKDELFYKDFLKCIGCKSCGFSCTASRAYGNIFGSKYNLGGTGILREYIHKGIESAVRDGLFLCTSCESCKIWCPMEINMSEILRQLKREATQKGYCPPPLEAYQEKILRNKNPFNQ